MASFGDEGSTGRGREGRSGRGGGRLRGTGRKGKQPLRLTQAPETVQERKARVKNIVKNLSLETARGILVDVVEQQPGIIFDLLDKVEPAVPGYHPPAGTSSPSWCVCSHCRKMPTMVERQCCGMHPNNCISQLPDIDRYILDEGVLAIARTYRQQLLVFPPQEVEINKANRHAAYRQFVLWKHGRPGRGIRRVIPGCCVWRTRDKYPSQFGYTGFKEPIGF